MMTKIHAMLVAVLLSVPASVSAQDMMPVTVQADRLKIGAEFVPRCLTSPTVKTIAAGQMFEAEADSTFDCIEVAGTLKVSRTHDTVLRVTTLMILPGGVLDVGTVADPVLRKVEIIIRNVPIDLAKDPFQWGNGLLNFGTQTRVGASKLTFTTTTGDLAVGATSITLAADPTGWQIGDELQLPDTQQAVFPTMARREFVTIASLTGRTIGLAAPLTIAHSAIRDPQGVIKLLPRVANLTRNIVIRSETPTGIPGHTANVGHTAKWDVRFNEFRGLGRTKAQTLNDAVADATAPAGFKAGTNQKGRYADHDHHAMGLGSSSVGNVIRGVGLSGSKWGIAVHGTHDAQIVDNIVLDIPGAGIVTEDGYEVRNVFRHNYVSGCSTPPDDANQAQVNAESNNPGSESSGFWMRGPHQTMTDNEVWNCGTGIDLFNQNQNPGSFPSVPGGMPDTAFNRFTHGMPLAFDRNVMAANVSVGLEYWSVPLYTTNDLIIANNGRMQFFQPVSFPAQSQHRNLTLIAQGGTTTAVHANKAYTTHLIVDGGQIAGCGKGIDDGGEFLTHLADVTFQCVTNLYMPSVNLVLEHINVMHKPLPGFPPHYIEFGTEDVWTPSTPLDPFETSQWMYQQGSPHVITNWQGTGQNFRLLRKQQLSTNLARPSEYDRGQGVFNPPEAGLTLGQSWAKYGLSFGGDVITPAEVVLLTGLDHGLARAGLGIPLGPPRSVVTFPSRLQPAMIETYFDGRPTIRVHGLITGNGAGTSTLFLVSVDGGPPFFVRQSEFQRPDERSFNIFATAPGLHEIKTWRTLPDATGTRIDATLMTFNYCVGTCGNPPPPPVCTPPQVLTNGVCVTPPPPPPPPVDVCPNIPGNQATVPVGMVLVNGQCVATPPPPPPPPTEVWTLILGAAAGPRIEQLRISDAPQDRYRICGGGAGQACRELALKP